MKVSFYFGHPSQFHFYKNIVRVLKENGHEIFLFIKTKDVLEKLVIETGWPYINIQPRERGKSKWATMMSLLKRDFFISCQVLKHKPDLLVASDPSFSHVGFLFRTPSLNFIDDDFDAAGDYAKITYPFTNTIITPLPVRVGKWEHKRISYPGFMKLAYLHPNWFVPDATKIGDLKSKSYFIIRLSRLSAHHDTHQLGISQNLLKSIIEKLSQAGRVIITSEGPIDPELAPYQWDIPVVEMHHFLYHAKALISDSQSMSGEAAMLGVPSVRISSFKGRLSVLEELEHKYGLTYAFNPVEESEIIKKIEVLLEMNDLTEVFKQRREMMLADMIDVTAFAVWFVENFPKSRCIMQENPSYTNKFRQD
jgi:predicted glycosyltransferase